MLYGKRNTFIKRRSFSIKATNRGLNKKLEDLNLNPKRKETSVVEGKGVTIVAPIAVGPIIVAPMKHPNVKEIIEIVLN